MEKTRHIFNNSIYLISSQAVARNGIFYQTSIAKRFLQKADFYLGELCEILHYSIYNEGFELMIRTKGREDFCKYYRARMADERIAEKNIPLTTHIFSKAMADLLVSTAKHFNYHHQRKGAVFSSRFTRDLMEDKKTYDRHIERMHNMVPPQKQNRPWNEIPGAYRLRKTRNELREMKERCSSVYYRRNGLLNQSLRSFKRIKEKDLRGCLMKPPPKSIFSIYERIGLVFYIPTTAPFP
jgi:hypothetical protein